MPASSRSNTRAVCVVDSSRLAAASAEISGPGAAPSNRNSLAAGGVSSSR